MHILVLSMYFTFIPNNYKRLLQLPTKVKLNRSAFLDNKGSDQLLLNELYAQQINRW